MISTHGDVILLVGLGYTTKEELENRIRNGKGFHFWEQMKVNSLSET